MSWVAVFGLRTGSHTLHSKIFYLIIIQEENKGNLVPWLLNLKHKLHVQRQVLLHKPGQTSPAENKNTKRMDFFVLIVGSFVGWGLGLFLMHLFTFTLALHGWVDVDNFQVPFIFHDLYKASLDVCHLVWWLQHNIIWTSAWCWIFAQVLCYLCGRILRITSYDGIMYMCGGSFTVLF